MPLTRRAVRPYGTRPPRATTVAGRVNALQALSRDHLEKLASYRTFTLHHGQTRAWRALHQQRYEVVSIFAGTGGGKTWAGPRLLYPLLRSGLDKKHLWVEPTWQMLKRVMLPEVLPFLDSFKLGEMHWGDMVYHLRGGGAIFFGSVNNPNSLQGNHINGTVWGDEVGLWTEEAFDVVMQRRNLFRATCLFTSTPYTLPWCEKRLAKPAQEGHPDSALYHIIQFPSYWNPLYSKEEYFRLKRIWPKDKFERLMNGEFTRINGLVYDSFDERRNLCHLTPLPGRKLLVTRQGHTREVQLMRVWAGHDWGWGDPGVTLLRGVDTQGQGYVWGEHYESGIPFANLRDPLAGDTWTTRMLKLDAEWGLEAIYCDPSRPENIKAWAALGLPAVGAINDHEYGFDAVNQELHGTGESHPPLLIDASSCPNLLRTIGSYVRAKRPGSDDYLPHPADNQDDHAEDCLRYSVVGDKRPTHPDAMYAPDPVVLPGKRRRRG